MNSYSFRDCTIEGLNAVDIVWNYFHKDDAVMPRILEEFAVLSKDLKQQVAAKEISLNKAKREMVAYWESLMDCFIDSKEKDCLEFAKEVFEQIPD